MSGLEAALRRLDAALDAAEQAVVRALDAADAARLREQELQAFADDRTRLADLLDGAAVTAETTQSAKQELARRLDVAIAAVQDALAETEG